MVHRGWDDPPDWTETAIPLAVILLMVYVVSWMLGKLF